MTLASHHGHSEFRAGVARLNDPAVRAYYNEIDPHAAQWLRNLIAAGLIAPGDVDTRSIADVRATDLQGYTQCHFFAGIGGWSAALRIYGWPDGRPVWTGSCPCQPFSGAGKQLGFNDERHLWPVWRGLIRQRSPAVIFGEQVTRAAEWLRLVRSNLEAMGYAVGAMPIEAASAGAQHRRDRFWLFADAQRDEQPWQKPRCRPAGRMGRQQQSLPEDTPWPCALSRFRIMGHGLPRSVGATDAARNAIDLRPTVAFISAADAAMRACRMPALGSKDGTGGAA